MPLFDARRKSSSIPRIIAYLVAAVLFADIALGSYQDGKSLWKAALAAVLFGIASLLYFVRHIRTRNDFELR